MQSYCPCGVRRSFKLIRPPIRRQYFSIVSSRDSFKWAARRWTSSSLIHTYPGAPVQQFPHWLQVNFSPSANHGVSVFAGSMTFSFIAAGIVIHRPCRRASAASLSAR
jgi:hypothetical protein